ncbi:MAG: PfkB family carbohydrate kinase [Phycisphaerae bacterium]|nr:PfkB family carbohydrate kinase [Phycisphaerae bacterium]
MTRLASWKSCKVMVIGDFMLDQHVYGAAERLSPDAPVPVLMAGDPRDIHESPGGASNVASCLRALDADVCCFGVVGGDQEGDSLRRRLRDMGCGVDGVIVDPSRPTTVKRNLIGLAQHRHPQKMFRLDFESREPLGRAVSERLLGAILNAIGTVDVICIEDYNKGVCTTNVCQTVIDAARKVGKPVLVDPAAIEDYGRYRHATAITPNRTEAELATGMATPIDASIEHNARLAARLLGDVQLDAVVLTLDKHGALLLQRDGEPLHVPTVARTVYDVTGAGDMVLASLAAAIANGFRWDDAVAFANAAAGLEVEVFGAQPIPLSHIRRAILGLARPRSGKARSLEDLRVELAVHRDSGKRIVLTNGCFDVIHAGHVAYLREAKQQGDILVLGVNADEEVTRQKGAGRPIFNETERQEILGELLCVDYIVVFPEPTAHELIRAIRPDVYVKGGDYRPEQVNEFDLVRELGITMKLLAHRPGLGSTTIVERIRRLEAEQAGAAS